MILKESKLRCVDNSGARVVRCINFSKGTGGGYIGVGAIIKVAIQRYRDRRKLGGGEEERKPMLNLKATYFALVVSVRRNTRRFGNFFFKAGANRVILIKKKKKWELIGTNLPGFVVQELCAKHRPIEYAKFGLAAAYVL